MYHLPVIKYIFFASILISLNRVRSCNSYLGSVSVFFRQIYIWFSYDKRCNKGFKCSKNAQFHTDFSKNFASILISLNRVRSCNSYLGIISVFFRQIYRYISNDKRCNNGLKCSKMHNFTLIFPKKFRPPLAPPHDGGLRPPLRNWPVAPLLQASTYFLQVKMRYH